MQKQFDEVAKAQRRLPKIEAEMQTAEVGSDEVIYTDIRLLTHTPQSQFTLASEAVEQFEREIAELGDIDHLTKQRDNLQEKMRANRGKIANFKVYPPRLLLYFHLDTIFVFRMMRNR